MKTKHAILAAFAATMLAFTAAPVSAIDNMDYNSPDSPTGYENLFNAMTRKLGRGVSNAGFGALELPLRIFHVNFEEGGIAAVTYGLFSGIGYFVVREVVGVVEIVTFLFPLPGCNPEGGGRISGYGPIVTPEWIITPETNYENFVYANSSFMQ